ATVVKPSRSESTKRRRPPAILTLNIATVFLGIGVWWAISLTGLQIPSPASVVASAFGLAQRGILLTDTIASLRRVRSGFLLGSALALPLGLSMGWHGCAHGLLDPWVQFFRTIPPLALIPLAIVLMSIGEEPKIFVIFLAAFLACVISPF